MKMNPSNLLTRFSQTIAGFSFVWFFFLLLSYREHSSNSVYVSIVIIFEATHILNQMKNEGHMKTGPSFFYHQN